MEPLFRRGKMIIFSTRSTDAMPCRREIVIMGDRAEVRDYHAAHTGRMGKRAAKSKPTPEAVRRAYLRKKERELRWLMNANFRDRVDALVTFSWPKGERPAGYREVLKAAQQLTRSLRKEYRNYGIELKYVYTMEIGPKGSRHIHMVLSNVNLLLLSACWPFATIDVKPLWSDGDYGDIAAYFIKYWEKTSTTEGMKLGRRCYNPSMNLWKPEIIRETIPETCDEKDAASLLYANELGEFYLMKAEDVLPTAAADFEGLSVSVPKNPDACLRRIYGDNYMGYPPDGFPHHGKDGARLADWAGNSGTDMQEVIRTLESIYQNL